MQRYTIDERCEKCSGSLKVKFVQGEAFSTGTVQNPKVWQTPGRLDCTCLTCGHFVQREPLDAKES